MKQLTIIIMFLYSFSLFAQTENEPLLLGKIKKDDLLKKPYSEWFNKEYDNYEIDRDVLNQLKKINQKDVSVTIFLGTWCGDSHREVPRFIKILEAMGIASDRIELVAVNSGDNVHKQSPTGEEKGKYIFKVPTFIISKGNKEINRIVEFPVLSLERDLLSVMSDNQYSPNYRSYPHVINWLEKGYLTDKNIPVQGLAEQIRFSTRSAGEITAVAYVLLCQGKMQEASKLYKIATALYPETVNYYTCAMAYAQNGEYDEAIDAVKKYLMKSSDKESIDKTLELYDRIKINKK